MQNIQSEILVALPEVFLLGMACVILLVDVFLSKTYRQVTFYLIQLTLVAAFFLTLPQFKEYPEPLIVFSGNYVVDKLAVLSKLFIYLFSFFAFAYARNYIAERKIAFGEYFLLGLFAVLGMSIMASSNTFLTIFLGLELLSLPLYAMVAMNKDFPTASEAAMKYFILGSLASGLLLYGISLLYGLTENISMNGVAQILGNRQEVLPIVALVFVLAGLIFKFGAVPFHMWVPDVYEGAASPTTLFIASAPKIATFAVTLRVLVQALPSLEPSWEPILIAVAILSMGLGNILAIVQTSFKRMLAYSSIGHIGYTLLGIIAGPNSAEGYSAAMFYIATYVLVAAGAFAIIALMSQKGVELDRLDDLRGLNTKNPWLAFMMLLLLFSMAGVPPTVGFIAKLGLLEALVEANFVWLAVVALIFALIGAYYYLRVVMLMYFEEPQAGTTAAMPVQLSTDMRLVITLNGMAALVLGLLPSYFIDLCRISAG